MKDIDIMIRKATVEDIEEVTSIYDELHNAEEAGEIVIGWKRNVYPTRNTAEKAFEQGELFVYESNGKVIASAIINHNQCECYQNANWSEVVADDKVLVLHTMTVNPQCFHLGIGQKIVAFFERLASERNCKWVRLDTQTKNVNPRSFYPKVGYTEVEVVRTAGFNGLGEVELALFEKRIAR